MVVSQLLKQSQRTRLTISETENECEVRDGLPMRTAWQGAKVLLPRDAPKKVGERRVAAACNRAGVDLADVEVGAVWAPCHEVAFISGSWRLISG